MSSSRRNERETRESRDRGLLPDRDREVAWPFQDPEEDDQQPVSIRERSDTDRALFDMADDWVYRNHPSHRLNELRRNGLWER